MNYKKQVPISQSEIDFVNSIPFVELINIHNYPNNGKHVEIMWQLPIRITRNEDSFWLNGITRNKANYWCVYTLDTSEEDFDFKQKQFKDVKKAIEYAVKQYKLWLEKRLSYVKKSLIIP